MSSAADSVFDRPIGRGRAEKVVSSSAFSFLFSELVQYSQDRVQKIGDLEHRLEVAGERVGVRAAELCSFRDKPGKRETRLVNMLQFIRQNVWSMLFGKPADGLERSTRSEDEYMLIEFDPLPSRYVSVPRDLGQLNCAAFSAGIIAGVLKNAGFDASVSAHFVETPGAPRDKTVYLIKFEAHVMEREKRMT